MAFQLTGSWNIRLSVSTSTWKPGSWSLDDRMIVVNRHKQNVDGLCHQFAASSRNLHPYITSEPPQWKGLLLFRHASRFEPSEGSCGGLS